MQTNKEIGLGRLKRSKNNNRWLVPTRSEKELLQDGCRTGRQAPA